MELIKLTQDRLIMLLFLWAVSWYVGALFDLVGIISHWIVFTTLCILSSAAYLTMASMKINPSKKAVFVTGCDSGFGHALALHLDKLGFRVFAGCLCADADGDGAKSLREKASAKLHVLQIDVTDEKQVKEARKRLEELLPEDEILWGIVNNAGISAFGDVEWAPMSVYRKTVEINLLGMINVIKGFLPLVRKHKGRVVNVASMLGRFEVAMRSPYIASKYAVEGLSGCLRQEMLPWGVRVIIIEPGNYVAATNMWTDETVRRHKDEMWDSMSEEVRRDYKEDFDNRMGIMLSYTNVGEKDITPVIQAFEDALTQEYPQARYNPMNIYYKVRMLIGTHLPEFIYDYCYSGCINK